MTTIKVAVKTDSSACVFLAIFAVLAQNRIVLAQFPLYMLPNLLNLGPYLSPAGFPIRLVSIDQSAGRATRSFHIVAPYDVRHAYRVYSVRYARRAKLACDSPSNIIIVGVSLCVTYRRFGFSFEMSSKC